MNDFTVEKYALVPFPNQERELRRWCEELRFLWNYALDERRSKVVSINDQKRSLTRWRDYDKTGVGSMLSHIAQDQLQRLDDAFTATRRRRNNGERAGKVHYKREGELTSFTHPDGDGSFRIEQTGRNGTWRLHLSGGQHGEDMDIPVVVHRPPPNETLGPVTVERHMDRWFVALTYKIESAPLPAGPPTSAVGIDIGVKSPLTLSDGTSVAPPKFYRTAEKRLARAQRVLSRRRGARRGETKSANYIKQAEKVARIQYRIARQRKDFAHKQTTAIVRAHDGVGVEDMSLGFMLRNHGLAKSASDAGLGQIVRMLEYKERRRSGWFGKVDPRGTSQDCSRCGGHPSTPVGLDVRTYVCEHCGMIMDRDQNAAINIRSRFIAEVTLRTLGEVTPVGEKLPLKRKGRKTHALLQACSLKQEPPCAASMLGPTGPSGPSLGGS